MGNKIIKEILRCTDPDIDDNENEIYYKRNNFNDLFDSIVFNQSDYEHLLSDKNNNYEFNEILYNDIFFGQKLGILNNKQIKDIPNKEILFYNFNNIIHKKLGIIIILSNDEQTSFNRLQILLNGIEKKIINDIKTQELIQKNCSLFLLNNKYEIYQLIMAYAELNENDLPFILFVKKNYKGQELDGDCIKFSTSEFEDYDFFLDTLKNLLNQIENDDNQEYPKKQLIIPEKENNNHNYFITNKIKNDSLNENNLNEIKKDSLNENNLNEIKNDSLNENNLNEIKNDSLNENNIEDVKIDNFKNDFDSMNLSNKNKNPNINNINNEKSIKKINNFITDNEINEAKENLNIEPDEDNENCTEIIIRYPNSGKRASRRFLKEEKIQYLYNYLISLDDFVQEINYQNFYMTQPFPKKYFKDLDESFENYGLYPDGIIDIEIIK